MQPHTNYFFKKALSGSYSRKVEKRKQRLLKKDKEGKPIETISRRKNWSRYFADYRSVSESLESYYQTNGGFIDRLEIHQDCLTKKNTTYPFRLVKRGLSDEAYSAVSRLPLYDVQARLEAAMGEELCREYFKFYFQTPFVFL